MTLDCEQRAVVGRLFLSASRTISARDQAAAVLRQQRGEKAAQLRHATQVAKSLQKKAPNPLIRLETDSTRGRRRRQRREARDLGPLSLARRSARSLSP